MITFREFLLTESAESEAKNAYSQGMADAEASRPKQNASDVFGPYNRDYSAGYRAGQKKTSNSKTTSK